MRLAGRIEDALAGAQSLLSSEPDSIPLLMELAACHRAASRHDEALAIVERAVRLRPSDAGLRLALGGCLKSLHRTLDAAAECRRAIELQPSFLPAYNNLGACLHELGRLSEVEALFRGAQRVFPNSPEVSMNLGWCLYLQGRLGEAQAQLRRAIELAPSWVEANSRLLFVMLHDGDCSPQQIFEEHLAWARRHADPLAATIQPHRNDHNPDRRLRIGYLSTDFRDTAMMFFIEPLLANHDHERFEITCYGDAPDADAVTARVERYANRWRNIAGWSDEQAARQIREDQIDILIELSGHNGGDLLKIMARKPAPVQASYLGYAHSTGLDPIDYRIVDAYVDPPGMTEQWYTEKVIRLPKANWVYRPPADAPAVAPAPCLANGFVTFGSFNVLPKITPAVIEVWSRVLNAVADSRLVLKGSGYSDPQTRARFVEHFTRHGVDARRLEFLDRTPVRAAHLAEYARMDIALDPFPYNGTTTTCEAMWMGVPIVALAGRAHVDRVSVSLLENMGLHELLGQSPDDYVRIASELAADRDRLTNLRTNMRRRMEASPIRDEIGFARAMEAAYCDMWRGWCNGSSSFRSG